MIKLKKQLLSVINKLLKSAQAGIIETLKYIVTASRSLILGWVYLLAWQSLAQVFFGSV